VTSAAARRGIRRFAALRGMRRFAALRGIRHFAARRGILHFAAPLAWLVLSGLDPAVAATPVAALDPSLVRFVEAAMRSHDVPALAIAVIDDGRVASLQAFGVRDAARTRPLTPDTVMSAASLTKGVFATEYLRRVGELDRPLPELLPQPLPAYPRYVDLADDPRWRRLTPRMLLDHTTGFANLRWLEPDEKLRFHRDPGVRYGYSGEGIGIAQLVFELRTGDDVETALKRDVFTPLGMSHTSMIWRDAFADGPDGVADHFLDDGTTLAHRRRKRADAIGSLDTTPRDMAAFVAALVRGDVLDAQRFAEMTKRQVAIDSPTQFPTLSDDRTSANDAIALGYGLGWVVFETARGRAFSKAGHDDGVANFAVCLVAARDCVLLMSNSTRAELLFASVVERVLHVQIPWRWESYGPPE
jgi:CubicO group peptidase (beta-lactamase class C family)